MTEENETFANLKIFDVADSFLIKWMEPIESTQFWINIKTLIVRN